MENFAFVLSKQYAHIVDQSFEYDQKTIKQYN